MTCCTGSLFLRGTETSMIQVLGTREKEEIPEHFSTHGELLVVISAPCISNRLHEHHPSLNDQIYDKRKKTNFTRRTQYLQTEKILSMHEKSGWQLRAALLP